MKKEVTEYEEASKTKTYFKCEHCDKKWDEREPWDKGNESIKTLALQFRVVGLSGMYGGVTTGNDSSIFGNGTHEFSTLAYVDYCHDCYDNLFTPSLSMKVEEEEYYVEETTSHEYFCDFCEDNMGDSADHIASLNPYIKSYAGGARSFGSTKNSPTKYIANGYEDTFYLSEQDKNILKIEEELDCCHACAVSIFGLPEREDGDVKSESKLLAARIKSFLIYGPNGM